MAGDVQEPEELRLDDEGLSHAGLSLEPSFGQGVQLVGRCEADPIAGSKRFQGIWLVLDDGTRYVLSYRPAAEYLAFADKRVVVQGRPYQPGSDTQHVMALHLAVDAITLAPGEQPHAIPPAAPPPPPLVRTADELAERDGRWAQVVGRLRAVGTDPDGYLGQAEVELADATVILVRGIPLGGWREHVGRLVTIVSRVRVESGSFELTGTCTLAAHPQPGESVDDC